MRLMRLDDVREVLDDAIKGKLCVEGWLGYASVLFVGFADNEINNETHYLLQTEYADWRIEDETGIIGTADDESTEAESAANLLVGHKAIDWTFIGTSLALEIYFECNLRIVISTMAEADRDLTHKVAWSLRMPDEYYRHLKWDGTIYDLHKDEPGSLEPICE